VLVYPACRSVVSMAVNGWGALSLAHLAETTAVGVLMYMLIFSFFILIGFLVRDTGKTIGICILCYLFYSLLYTMVAPDLFLFAEASPAVVFDGLAGYRLTPAAAANAALTAFAGMVTIAGVTYALFRKSDV